MNDRLKPLTLTRDLLLYDTINPPGQERKCAEYLGKLLEDGGFQTAYYEYEESRTSLVARIEGKSDKAPICFTGHIDTVPLGAAHWSKDPFSGELDGDKIFGRGSTDMKGGVAAMVLAAIEISKYSRGEAGIEVVLTAGEEYGCVGAHHLAQTDGALGKAGAVVVGEPTSNYPLIGHKGLVWLEVRTSGVTAHGSMPEEGVNAIFKAGKVINKLEQFRFHESPHEFLGKPTLNVGTISGGLNINSVPDQTSICLDIRTIPGQENDEIKKRLQNYLGNEVEILTIVESRNVASDSSNEWIQEVFSIMTPYLHESPQPRGATYSTDACALTPAYNNPPTVILGPGEPDIAHKTDEFCYTSKLEESKEVYLEIAKRWCHL
ncbi:MAG: M20 family metallopeptidase [SAR324 cluster bacterium]|nr:M20 family metallopeptidase [SAR324 cluster bacterium]